MRTDPKVLLLIDASDLFINEFSEEATQVGFFMNNKLLEMIDEVKIELIKKYRNELYEDKEETDSSDLLDHFELHHHFDSRIEIALFVSEEQYQKNNLLVGSRNAQRELKLMEALKMVDDSTQLLLGLSQSERSSTANKFNLLKFKESQTGDLIFDEKILTKQVGNFGERIVVFSSNDEFKESIAQAVNDQAFFVKCYKANQCDINDYEDLKNYLDFLKKENQLGKFEEVVFYLDIDYTALLNDYATFNNKVVINHDVFRLNNLLKQYFPESAIKFKVLTARGCPTRGREHLEAKYNKKMISKEMFDKECEASNQFHQGPLGIAQIIKAFKELYGIHIVIEDNSFTGNKHLKRIIMEKDSAQGKKPVFMLFYDDNDKELGPARQLMASLATSKLPGQLAVIKSHVEGEIDEAGDAIVEFVGDVLEQQKSSQAMVMTEVDINQFIMQQFSMFPVHPASQPQPLYFSPLNLNGGSLCFWNGSGGTNLNNSVDSKTNGANHFTGKTERHDSDPDFKKNTHYV